MRHVIGIDEVGRGPLAGPVVVAAAALPRNFLYSKKQVPCELRDSKRLTQKQREAWCKYLVGHPKIYFALARVYPSSIDRLNVAQAANLAAWRAYSRLSDAAGLRPGAHRIYLDGGLFLGKKRDFPGAKTVIRADQSIPAVQIASILAKVSRDRFMVRLAKKYPVYGLEKHKGYGTKAHFLAVKKHGPSPIHRLTFLS